MPGLLTVLGFTPPSRLSVTQEWRGLTTHSTRRFDSNNFHSYVISCGWCVGRASKPPSKQKGAKI